MLNSLRGKLFGKVYAHSQREIANLLDATAYRLEVVLPTGDVVVVEVNDGNGYGPDSDYTVQVGVRAFNEQNGKWVLFDKVSSLIAGRRREIGSGYAPGAGTIGWAWHPENPESAPY